MESISDIAAERAAIYRRPRIADFMARLKAAVPLHPKSRSAGAPATPESLPDLLLRYVNYADRFIAARPRRVGFLDGFWTTCPPELIGDIAATIQEIEAGTDLTARLSHKIRREGYAPNHDDKWADKDFALNVYDLHHLHVGARDKNGRVKHANALLFVHFTRNEAIPLFVGDHKSFDDEKAEKAIAALRAATGFTLKGVLPPRREDDAPRPNIARRGFSTTAVVGSEVVLAAMQTASGHRLRSGRLADRIALTVENFDVQIDDQARLRQIFGVHANRLSEEPTLEWHMRHLDLALIDLRSGTAGIFIQGDR